MPIPNEDNINSDLGLGSRVAQTSTLRFLNKDGSFNVERAGLPWSQSLNPYHALLNLSWPKFLLLVMASFLLANLLFALCYLALGPEAFHGMEGTTLTARFFESYFFSVQTMATIGYGSISPRSIGANLFVTLEAMVELMGLALATGLLFARFSRPKAKIVFSRTGLIAPYQGKTAFEFRIANMQASELIDVRATVIFTRMESSGGKPVRKFYQLALERTGVMFFPLHWVVVHPITETSPLFGLTDADLASTDAEFLVLLTAFDETFSQTVHTRSSYKHHEVIWGAKFSDLFLPARTGGVGIDMKKIHDYELTNIA